MDSPVSPGVITPPRVAFWHKDDWWAVSIGLLLVALAFALFQAGSSLALAAVLPPKWTAPAQLLAHFSLSWPGYAALLALWAVLLTPAAFAIGLQPARFLAGFVFLFIVSTGIFAFGQWSVALRYNLEPPLVALLLGLLLGNSGVVPTAWQAAFRVELYIKIGVVLLGATLPFTLIAWAGPVALLQASIVSIVTFGVIFTAARALGQDPRFAAVLGVGGAVCGVSAAIAIGAAVGARRQDVAATISIVIAWAIVMIFVLPFAAAGLGLPAGVGGAWIGTSEFADAAGFAAAQAYGDIAARVAGAAAGAADQSVAAFTLMKVVGRDIWIGIWAIALSIVAARFWDDTGIRQRPNAGEIWRRFPKFVLGFIAASLLITLVAQGEGHAGFAKLGTPGLLTPIKTLRSWAFAFGFLSIGLTTRPRELASVGLRPLAAFSLGVGVNLALGLALSALVFAGYWTRLGK